MARLVPGRCPPFSRSAPRITDGCSEAAAKAQAERINDLWRSIGRKANARAVQVAGADTHFAVWGVTSDLVNGMPPC